MLTKAEKKRQVLKDQEAKLIEEIKTLTSLCGQSDNVTTTNLNSDRPSPSKRFRSDFLDSLIPLSPIKTNAVVNVHSITPVANAPLTSTPRKRPLHPKRQLEKELTEQPRQQTSSSTIPVSVKVQWPSKTRERFLNKDLESLGKMLVRGT